MADLTEYAMQISNDADYGEYTNGEILDMNDDQLREYCEDYIEFINGMNRVSDLYEWEVELMKLLDMYICEDCMEIYSSKEGRPYKYEPEIWLCDGCHDERMENE